VIARHTGSCHSIVDGPAKLKAFGNDLSKAVAECASTMPQVITAEIKKAMEADDKTAFKLVKRFPQVVDNAMKCANDVCASKQKGMLEQLQHCIKYHLCVPSSSLTMVYDWNTFHVVKMEVNRDRLVGDFAHLVVANSAEIFDVFHKRLEAEVVNVTFSSTTVESCHDERQKLKMQQQKIKEVLTGIMTMAPDLEKTLDPSLSASITQCGVNIQQQPKVTCA